MNKIMLLFLFRLLFMLPMVWVMNGCDHAYAGIPGTNDAVRAILGESGSSLAEMRGIASAIRNRGHLRGVYGYKRVTEDLRNANTGHAYSDELVQRAYKAWADSEHVDYVNGADHWLSNWDLANAKPKLIAFRHEMVETAYIGTTHFYKES